MLSKTSSGPVMFPGLGNASRRSRPRSRHDGGAVRPAAARADEARRLQSRQGHYRFTAACQLKTTVNGDGVLCPAGAAKRNRSPSLVTAQSAAAPGTWNRTLWGPVGTPRSVAKATDVTAPFGAR